ncbi:hypothetical protein TNCV_1285871 [Trichonephila clavipes]|uniref:Uncharacterized protein n=1 Tax=Trichonephila clavipes TaxID=2585209 RepID=A0A8X6SV66_TRICX|nr:hypothetical protein TNCV_1285871 [Trichonephila clavipes]
MADGIRQTIMALSTVVDLYIEGKVIPTEFIVLPDAKGNKTLLGLDFLNAAGTVLDIRGGKWHFSGNPRGETVQILQEDIRRYNTQRIRTSKG